MKLKNRLPIIIMLLALLALFVSPVFAQDNDPPSEPVTPQVVTVEPPLPVETPEGNDLNGLVVTAVAGLVIFGFKVFSTWWSDWKTKKYWEADALENIARTAVRYAEQTGATKAGQEKLGEAMDYAQAWLKIRGIKVDLFVLRGMIEAKVHETLNSGNDSNKG